MRKEIMTRRFVPFSAALMLAPLLSACGDASAPEASPSPDDSVIASNVAPDLPEPEETAAAVGEADPICGANLAEPYVGQTLDLQSRGALLDAVGAQVLTRFIETGDEFEEDTNPERLNIRTNEEKVITEVFCG